MSVVFVAASKLPTPFGEFTMHGFLDEESGKEHVALSMGDIADGAPVLGRLHSECLTGDALFSLRDLPNVVDIRAVGLVGGVQLAPHADGPGKRGYDVFERCFWEHDLMVRVTGDIIAMSPPLIIDKPHIDQIVERLAQAIRASV